MCINGSYSRIRAAWSESVGGYDTADFDAIDEGGYGIERDWDIAEVDDVRDTIFQARREFVKGEYEKEKNRERSYNYYWSHVESSRERARKSYWKNAEGRREKLRKYYREHAAEISVKRKVRHRSKNENASVADTDGTT